jgi:hypothetical protein
MWGLISKLGPGWPDWPMLRYMFGWWNFVDFASLVGFLVPKIGKSWKTSGQRRETAIHLPWDTWRHMGPHLGVRSGLAGSTHHGRNTFGWWNWVEMPFSVGSSYWNRKHVQNVATTLETGKHVPWDMRGHTGPHLGVGSGWPDWPSSDTRWDGEIWWILPPRAGSWDKTGKSWTMGVVESEPSWADGHVVGYMYHVWTVESERICLHRRVPGSEYVTTVKNPVQVPNEHWVRKIHNKPYLKLVI